MNTAETERTLDLRILFFRVLKKWRLLLIFVLIGLLAGSAFKIIQGGKGTETVEEVVPATIVELTDEEYALAIEEYEAKKAEYELAFQEAEEAYNAYQEFLDASVIYNIDPNNVPYAYARIVVTATASEPDSPNASTVVSNGIRYIVYTLEGRLQDGTLMDRIASLTGREARFLKEAVSITIATSSGTLSVSVNYIDLETARKILDLILDYTKSVSGGIEADGIASYRVEPIKGYSGITIDSSINTTKTSLNKNLTALKKTYDEAEANLLKLTYPEQIIIKKAEKTVTKNVTVRKPAALKDILKYAAIAGAGAFVLALLFCFFRLIFPYKILSASDAGQDGRYPVFTDYGALTVKHRSKFDKWILRHLEGKTFDLDTDGHASIVRMSAEAALKDADALYLSSTLDDEGTDKVAESLKKAMPKLRVEVLKGISADPGRLEALPEGAAVMVVEKLEKSLHSGITAELGYLENRGADLKGFIVYE